VAPVAGVPPARRNEPRGLPPAVAALRRNFLGVSRNIMLNFRPPVLTLGATDAAVPRPTLPLRTPHCPRPHLECRRRHPHRLGGYHLSLRQAQPTRPRNPRCPRGRHEPL